MWRGQRAKRWQPEQVLAQTGAAHGQQQWNEADCLEAGCPCQRECRLLLATGKHAKLRRAAQDDAFSPRWPVQQWAWLHRLPAQADWHWRLSGKHFGLGEPCAAVERRRPVRVFAVRVQQEGSGRGRATQVGPWPMTEFAAAAAAEEEETADRPGLPPQSALHYERTGQGSWGLTKQKVWIDPELDAAEQMRPSETRRTPRSKAQGPRWDAGD